MLLRYIVTTGLLFLCVACADGEKSFDSSTTTKVMDNQEQPGEDAQSPLENFNDQVGQVPMQLRPGTYMAEMSSGELLILELENINTAKASLLVDPGRINEKRCNANLQPTEATANSVTYNMLLNPNNGSTCLKTNCRIIISSYQAESLSAEIFCSVGQDKGILSYGTL